MTRVEFLKAVATRTGIPYSKVCIVFGGIEDLLPDLLSEHGRIWLGPKLGAFERTTRSGKVIKHSFHGGGAVTTSAREAPAFRPSPAFKKDMAALGWTRRKKLGEVTQTPIGDGRWMLQKVRVENGKETLVGKPRALEDEDA
jgi:nucleoid DNA-binding protein